MSAIVDLRPQTLDINLYGVDPWSLQLTITGLGSLDGATIKAKVRPSAAGDTVNLDVTPVDLDAGTFTIGHSVPVDGTWDLEVAQPGGTPRTYLRGTIVVCQDQA